VESRFKGSLLALTRSVEEAYWQLQAAQRAERTIAQQVNLAGEVVRVTQAMLRAERAIIADVAKARSEFHDLRLSRLRAEASVREKELQLRTLMNVPPYDGRIIEPVTEPIAARIVYDRERSVELALDGQPKLVKQRVIVRIREVENLVAENGLRPQLDLLGLYRANGLDDDVGEALAMMGEQKYQDFEFGIRYSQPLGNRAPAARKRASDLDLTKERVVLDQQAMLLAYEVLDTLRELEATHAQFEESRAQAGEVARWLKGAQARYLSPPPAGSGVNWLQTALDDFLKAMRATADVAVENSALLARYNTALAELGELEGTLLETRGVRLTADPCIAARSLRLAPLAAERVLREVAALPPPPVKRDLALPATDAADPSADALVKAMGESEPAELDVRYIELARLPPVHD